MQASDVTKLALLTEEAQKRGIDLELVKARLKTQQIETPSWGYSDSGTRFGVFHQAGSAVTIEEKLADAGQVHKFTGVAPSVAVHVLWDFPEDVSIAEVAACAHRNGVRIGAINPNVFQDPIYAFGSITSEDAAVRQKAIDHILDSIEVGNALSSEVLSLWFADGTDYPGQGDFRRRKTYAQDSLQIVYDAMPLGMRMLIEYKPFEPAFYHTDIADWGMSYTFARNCGPNAHVLVDLGHHFSGQNIEHIVAFLLDEERLGGFHFNNHKYADDDLTVGSVNPYELFLIYNELVKAENAPNGNPPVAYMVDQAFVTKNKIEGMIQTVMTIQASYAKAMLIDSKELREAQLANDIVAAEMCLQQAYNTDVEPLLRVVREDMGIDPNPMEAFRTSGYMKKICEERGIRTGAGGVGA